jgi:transcriptional regulator with XRE-family HTH domain
MGTSHGLSPNQLVAYNLRRARELRGWTQEQAAAHLEPYVGTRWSKGTFSAAERSVAGGRVRQFDADELVALSLAFDLPLTWWFLPPEDDPAVVRLPGPELVEQVGADGQLEVPDPAGVAAPTKAPAGLAEVARLLDLILVGVTSPVGARIVKVLRAIPEPLRTAQQTMARQYAHALDAAVLVDEIDMMGALDGTIRDAVATLTRLADALAEVREFAARYFREQVDRNFITLEGPPPEREEPGP